MIKHKMNAAWSKIKRWFQPKQAPSVATKVETESAITPQGWQGTPDSLAEYQAMLNSAKIVRYQNQIDQAIKKIMANKSQFVEAVEGTIIPWYFFAILSFRESNVDMSRQVLNGQKWNRVTTIVPKGLGPWNSWMASTKFAIKFKKLDQLKSWTEAEILSRWERFNGLGYMKRGLRSPYLWGGTNLQQPGMYVADGKFSSTTYDPRPGCIAIYLRMKELGHIKALEG